MAICVAIDEKFTTDVSLEKDELIKFLKSSADEVRRLVVSDSFFASLSAKRWQYFICTRHYADDIIYGQRWAI